jgi:hypothetical protein
MEPNDPEVKRQRERFIKAFEQIAEASANSATVAKKQIEVMNKLIEAVNNQTEAITSVIMAPKDGLRDVVDDLIQEVSGLRDDLRAIAKAGGLSSVLALFGAQRRR